MPLNVLIAPDKFKGTLTARAAAEAIARGWRKVRPRDALKLIPISDGGDGFGEVLGDLLGARTQFIKTLDAAHRACRSEWGWEPKSKTAVIESARTIGLARLPAGKFHPFELDTFGLGAVIRAASDRGARRCFIGIGGSATNDGGFGLARALGWKFVDRNGATLERWTDLPALARIVAPKRRRWFQKLIVAVDVQNPLLGRRGATRVYGPQKGLRTEDFELAERCLRRLASVVGRGTKLHADPGTGAAGGLGFGLIAFLGARVEPGFDLFARCADLDRQLRSADLVLTGEGRIDSSTGMGKGVGEIAQRCRRLGIPCFGLAGEVIESVETRRAFTRIQALTHCTGLSQARARPAHWLERLAEIVAADFVPTSTATGSKDASRTRTLEACGT